MSPGVVILVARDPQISYSGSCIPAVARDLENGGNLTQQMTFIPEAYFHFHFNGKRLH